MACEDCNDTGYVTTFTTRKRCARCLAAKADGLINRVMVTKRAQARARANDGDWSDLSSWVANIDAAIVGEANVPKLGDPWPVVKLPLDAAKFITLPQGRVEYIGDGYYCVTFP